MAHGWKLQAFQGQAFHEFATEKGFHQRKVSPLWAKANGHAESFMMNLDKVARTTHSQGKDWRREFYVLVANYRTTPHPSTGKSPYESCMNRTVRTKLPTISQVNPDAEVMQKNQETKARIKAYANLKRRTKPHCLNVGDHALVKQRPQNKASPRFEPVPYTVQDVKGSMITAKRATDQKLVTRNSSFFKKLPNPPEEVIQESIQYLGWNYKSCLILMDKKPLNILKCQLFKRSLIRLPQVKSAQ